MIQRFHRILVTLTFTLRLALTLDNGLALTPPMGWLTWERFRCITDCQRYPSSCISEILIKEMSHHLVDDGYKDVGYEYIIIDDCWLANERDNNGRLQPDPERFPSGIAKLADYVHQLGLKFGIYEDFGVKTCGGYPGSEFYLELDAQTFADWGVDYVKFDGCNSDPSDMDFGYKTFGFYLNKTGRPMVYSCEWPLYQSLAGIKSDYAAIKDTCNLWRNHADVQDNWSSVESIIRYYSEDHNNISMYAGPGAWNDPDMLVIGNYGLSYEQSRVQMAMWAIMASPLIMSTDIRFISDEEKQLLQNKNIIQINQDPLGVQGTLVGRINGTVIEIWSRPLMKPTGSLAIALLQMDNTGAPTVVTVQAAELTLTNPTGYSLYEGFTGNKIFDIKGPIDTFEVLVNPNGVLLFTARPV